MLAGVQGPNRGDVKHAVELALRTWPEKTQQAIAEQVGCSQGYVSQRKADVIASNNVDFPAARTDSLGRNQPTTKTKATRVKAEQAVFDGDDEGRDGRTCPLARRFPTSGIHNHHPLRAP